MQRLIALIALLAALFASPVMAQTFPELTGRVVDQADIIPPNVEAELTQKLAGLEATTQRQLVVVTLASLDGYDIADYGYQLGREWGIGDAERNDGALLIVAPNERKTRIEVGYGLEPVLTDALSSIIVQQDILPISAMAIIPVVSWPGPMPSFSNCNCRRKKRPGLCRRPASPSAAKVASPLVV